MSFSAEVKNELARVFSPQKEGQLAELSALVRTTGSINIVGLGKLAFTIFTENPAIARKVFSLLKGCFDISVEIQMSGSQTKKSTPYQMYISNEQGANEILEALGIIEHAEDGLHLIDKIPTRFTSKKEAKKSYLRGVFLGCGSIGDPKRMYHMEYTTTDIDFAKKIMRLLISYDIPAKKIQRKNLQVVYVKDSEKIADVLNLTGAHNALLHMESIKVNKQVRNDINRLVNCETANLAKTVNTSERQIQSIEYIIEKKGIEYLPENLREIALLRRQHFDMSLKELGEIMDKPLGKSGVNHRLKKIEEIAEDLKEKIEQRKRTVAQARRNSEKDRNE